MVVISKEENVKKAIVTKWNGVYYFPATIPRERASMTSTHVAILTSLFAAHIYISKDQGILQCLAVYALVVFFYLLIIAVYRAILFIYELKHKESRYNNQLSQICMGAFYFKNKTYIVAALCMFYLVYFVTAFGLSSLIKSRVDKFWFFIVPFLFILHRILDLEHFPINDSLSISKDDGLDYGSGMAYSFFYGYINYMLAKIGDPNRNLKEMMIDYESKNDIRFAVYKIFILIPKSLECPESIQEASSLMEMRSTLPEKKITVAGVRERVYKHSVYTINHPKIKNKRVYVCSEYATPLKTFKEVFTNTTAHTEYYNRHKNDILLQFYLTFRRILEDNKMNSMCELIYYEDRDKDGNFHDVGRILLAKIAEIKKQEGIKEDYTSNESNVYKVDNVSHEKVPHSTLEGSDDNIKPRSEDPKKEL